MRRTTAFWGTRKQAPSDEQARNAQLLIRAGYIHKEMAGVYAYLPLGLKVLENIKNIVREEMNAVGGQELMMTTLQPKDIWERTDRWDDAKVDNWFKTKLKSGTELGVGLTHEEPIVDALSEYINSYKDLPILVYQIQSKFRNELRAKSGLLRGREFVMKDMYSFARTQAEHDELYEKLAAAYLRIYERLGLGEQTYRTYADGGYFTERFSDEFQTVSDVGEDTIYVNEAKKIAINAEIYSDETLAKLGLNRDELVEKRGVEVGNIFPLETKYTEALGVRYTDEHGVDQPIIMGCYGIGVSRLVGMIAEHFSDQHGLVWPEEVAPARVYIAQLGDDEATRQAATKLYDDLEIKGISVIYDDRPDVRTGEKLADADLLGMPHRVVVSTRNLAQNKLEYKRRTETESALLTFDELLAKLA